MCLTGKHPRPSEACRNSHMYWWQRELKWTEYKVTDMSGWIWPDSNFWKTFQLTACCTVQGFPQFLLLLKSYRTAASINKSNLTCYCIGVLIPFLYHNCVLGRRAFLTFFLSLSLLNVTEPCTTQKQVAWVRWLLSTETKNARNHTTRLQNYRCKSKVRYP